MVANMLDGVEVRLGEDYLEKKAEYDALAEKSDLYSLIDAYFDYQMGYLEYRSVRFETELLDKPNSREMQQSIIQTERLHGQGSLSINGLNLEKDDEGNDLPKTVISREYSSEWKTGR